MKIMYVFDGGINLKLDGKYPLFTIKNVVYVVELGIVIGSVITGGITSIWGIQTLFAGNVLPLIKIN